MRVLKFLITGAVGLCVNLGVFQALYLLGVPYLVGSIGGLALAILVGFILQKYWTFEGRAQARMHTQFVLYVGLALCNLGVNTFIVYVLVEYANAHYLIAQAIGAGLVAFTSYVVYKHYIFAETPK